MYIALQQDCSIEAGQFGVRLEKLNFFARKRFACIASPHLPLGEAKVDKHHAKVTANMIASNLVLDLSN